MLKAKEIMAKSLESKKLIPIFAASKSHGAVREDAAATSGYFFAQGHKEILPYAVKGRVAETPRWSQLCVNHDSPQSRVFLLSKNIEYGRHEIDAGEPAKSERSGERCHRLLSASHLRRRTGTDVQCPDTNYWTDGVSQAADDHHKRSRRTERCHQRSDDIHAGSQRISSLAEAICKDGGVNSSFVPLYI